MDRHEEFREFVAARGQALMGTAYLLTGGRHQAEDLLQTVLTRLVTRWHGIQADGNPEGYVRTALYREFVSWRRVARNREIPRADMPDIAGHENHEDTAVQRVVLEHALRRLTPRQRAVLVLRFYEDHSEADTARILGCSVGTVKSQTHHALRRMRTLAPELADLLSETHLTTPRSR
ncbi:SigE family RNA polymerase sigma factor [Sphaerisporangium flaviroseum]|uniref:SigE family RNA polymerase sigma factor n=1 Tax=Sphaerisporangium flaviroseum TaxID=509199 RepID=A0ABP7HSM3_9ACTN